MSSQKDNYEHLMGGGSSDDSDTDSDTDSGTDEK